MLFLYDKMDDPRIPGKLLFNDDDNASLPLHWHANVEICYFLQGGFRAHIDGQSYQVQNEDLLLVNSWQIWSSGGACARTWTSWNSGWTGPRTGSRS